MASLPLSDQHPHHDDHGDQDAVRGAGVAGAAVPELDQARLGAHRRWARAAAAGASGSSNWPIMRLRHRGRGSVVLRPGLRQIEGAEQAVDERQHRRIIVVLVILERVVPMVESRAGDDLLERPQAPAHVGVDEEAPQRADEQNQHRHQRRVRTDRRCETRRVEQRQAAQAGEDDIDRVAPRVDQKIHVLSAVVNGVESPQEAGVRGSSDGPSKSRFRRRSWRRPCAPIAAGQPPFR